MAPRADEGLVFGNRGRRSCHENCPSPSAPIRPSGAPFHLLLLLWGSSSCLTSAFVQLGIAPVHTALTSTATPPAMRIPAACSSQSHGRSTGRCPGCRWTRENPRRWTTTSESRVMARRRNLFFAHRVAGPPQLMTSTAEEEEEIRMSGEDTHPRSHTVEDIQSMKVADLRKECESRGLDKRGLKAELVARLSSHKNLSSSAKRMGHDGIADEESLHERDPVAGGGNARDTAQNFREMKVAELREQCKTFGLDGKGLKADLVERLEENASGSVSLSSDDAELEMTASEANHPPSSFESLGLSGDIISAAIASQGWDTPTAVQSAVIPQMLLGSDDRCSRDVGPPSDSSSGVQIWQAPTGSGKTGAYALPLLQRLLAGHGSVRHREDDGDRGSWDGESSVRVASLVLVPTRELALQIHSVLSDLVFALPPVATPGGRSNRGASSRQRHLNVRVVHGGSDQSVRDQLQELSDVGGGLIDVLVATPGRLLDVVRCQEDRARPDAALERRLLSALDAKRDAKANAPPKKRKKNKVWGQRRRRRRVVGDDVSLNLREVSEEELTRLLLAASDDEGDEEVTSPGSESFTMLRGVKFLILDEADKLLGKGFEEEMNELMTYVFFDATNGVDSDDDQVAGKDGGALFEQQGGADALEVHMFSATFPDKIRPRVQEIMRLCGQRTVGSPSVTRTSAGAGGDLVAKATGKTECVESTPSLVSRRSETDPLGVKSPNSTITLRTIRLDRKDRTQALRHLIEEAQEFDGDGDCWDRILVFVSTRRSSEHVAKKLRKAGIRSTTLHGKMDQMERVQTLEDFKQGQIRCLVATDLASRGLDVKGLPAVVNYDLPRSTSDFTHRIGRTGRAGLHGTAISFVTPENEAHFNLIEKRHFGGSMPAPREVLEGFEPNEESWRVVAAASRSTVPGVAHSQLGLPHDKMHGGIKGRRKSKKDKLREAAARQREKDPGLSTE